MQQGQSLEGETLPPVVFVWGFGELSAEDEDDGRDGAENETGW